MENLVYMACSMHTMNEFRGQYWVIETSVLFGGLDIPMDVVSAAFLGIL